MVKIGRRSAFVISMVAVIGLAAGACGSSSTESGSGSSGSSGSSSSTAPGSTAGPGTTKAPGTTAPAAGTVLPAVTEIVVISTPYGDALGTDDGLVLYTWDEEADGTIQCTSDGCVEKWPPLLATEVGEIPGIEAGRVALVERPDGSTQVTLDGRPLYHMAVDEPGEATCQGAEGWWILDPDGTKNTNEVPRA